MEKPKKKRDEEKVRQHIRGFDLGSGVNISIASHKDAEDTEGSIAYVFSSRLPKLATDAQNAQKILEVEFSSTEDDNKELLHALFKKTKSQKQ